MKVCVTGANSLLGTNLIELLLTKGYEVTGMLRTPSKFVLDPHPNLKLVQGDVRVKTGLNKILVNQDAVIHTAAITAPNLKKYKTYHDVNTIGTQNILEVAHLAGVKKFIYVSTANSFGHGSKAQPGTEELPPRSPFSKGLYARSKLAAEHIVRSYSNKMHIAIANPTFMIGRYDTKPSSGVVLLMANKRILFHPRGGKNFVNVADVVQGVLTILEKGTNGRAYLLCNENLYYGEFFRKVKSQLEKPQLLIPIPKIVLLIAGCVGSLLHKIGVNSPITLNTARILNIANHYTARRAKDELGIKFTPIEEGISDAIAWFKLKE